MSHLPTRPLVEFRRGPLASADLNANFATLLGLIEIVMHTALTPDPVGVAGEVRLAAHDERLDRIEKLLAMHARQRNERELTPLAYTGAILQQVQAQERRLARLEQQPEPATKEDHDARFKDLAQRITDLERQRGLSCPDSR